MLIYVLGLSGLFTNKDGSGESEEPIYAEAVDVFSAIAPKVIPRQGMLHLLADIYYIIYKFKSICVNKCIYFSGCK